MRTETSRRLLVGTAVAALVFTTGIGRAPHEGATLVFYDVVLLSGITLMASVLCLGAARRVPQERNAWLVGALPWVLGVIANTIHGLTSVPGGTPPFPTVADVFWLGSYLPLAAVVLLLLRSRASASGPATWLDGLIGGCGAAAVALTVMHGLLPPLPPLDPLGTLTALAYPSADVVLLTLLGAVGAVLGLHRDRTLLLIALALTAKLVGDVLVIDAVLRHGGYVLGSAVDLAFVAAALLAGWAAHRTQGPTTPPETGPPGSRTSWRLVAMPLACNIAGLVVLGIEWGDGTVTVQEVCALICVVAALVRTAVTVGELSALHGVRVQARTDDLTGLPNRRALLEAAERVVASSSAREPAALLLLDLDGFKEVNDTLGHAAGDALLRELGPRLRTALRPGDLLARLGGDEFAVLVTATGVEEAQELAQRLVTLVAEPFDVHAVRLRVGVSIGVATAPVPAASVQELLRCADVAMYAAKTDGGGVRAYLPHPDGGTSDRLRTMDELRTALAGNELLVHVQPQVRLADGAVVGAEALVRWQHPTRGLLSPVHLLPAAEQAGLLRPLAERVLELSLAAATGWWSTRGIPVSVNLSAADVTDLDLPGKVAAALERHGLPARALTLELVEDTLMADPERGRTVLGELRRLGVGTSIDDYGTGYSSLAHLRTLPADQVKLDRSLTCDMAADPRAATIVRHTVALAHDLDISLVAEGVEDGDTATVLHVLGCDVAQGYAIARPMPVDAFLAWIAEPRPPLIAGDRFAPR